MRINDDEVEGLARVLCAAEGIDPDARVSPGGKRAWHLRREQAETLLADPAPLLAALAGAGVLHRQTRRLQRGGPRERRYATVDPDGRSEHGAGAATGWEASL